MRIFIKSFAASLFLLLLITGSAWGDTPLRRAKPEKTPKPQKSYVQNEIVVKFRGAPKHRVIKLPRNLTVEAAIQKYRGRADIEYAEPNYIARALMTPDDPYYSYQWHLSNSSYGGTNVESAWDQSTGEGVVVAVIDTGIAYEDHREGRGFWGRRFYQAPDLAATCFVSGYDFVEDDTHPNDDNSHGTHVAGTIAQSTNNGLGVAGVAFTSCLMPIKVLDRDGYGTYADVAEGIRWAADHGARVINLSLGGPTPATYLEEAVAYAYEKGVTIIAAAGNDGSSNVSYPAAYDDYVIAVGATRFDETLVGYSNYGPSLDLVAPGGDLDVDQNGDGYADGILQNTFNPASRNTSDFGYYFFQGTSMAAPHVAGVAALVIADGIATTPDAVRTILQESAEDLGPTGWDETYGHGLIDAAAALDVTPSPPPPGEEPVLKTMHVGDITFSYRQRGRRVLRCRVTVTVPVLDSSGSGVPGALVAGSWSGAYAKEVSDLTVDDGRVRFTTPWIRGCGTFTFTVSDVSKDGWTYDSSLNLETSDSITP